MPDPFIINEPSLEVTVELLSDFGRQLTQLIRLRDTMLNYKYCDQLIDIEPIPTCINILRGLAILEKSLTVNGEAGWMAFRHKHTMGRTKEMVTLCDASIVCMKGPIGLKTASCDDNHQLSSNVANNK